MRSFIVIGMFAASLAHADWSDYEEVRDLEALDVTAADPSEALLHELGGHVPKHPRVHRRRACDHSDVAGVALVAGAREAQLLEVHHRAAAARRA